VRGSYLTILERVVCRIGLDLHYADISLAEKRDQLQRALTFFSASIMRCVACGEQDETMLTKMATLVLNTVGNFHSNDTNTGGIFQHYVTGALEVSLPMLSLLDPVILRHLCCSVTAIDPWEVRVSLFSLLTEMSVHGNAALETCRHLILADCKRSAVLASGYIVKWAQRERTALFRDCMARIVAAAQTADDPALVGSVELQARTILEALDLGRRAA
jgi:hypothetical protein